MPPAVTNADRQTGNFFVVCIFLYGIEIWQFAFFSIFKSTCQCNDKIHMVFNKLKRKSYKSIYTINLRTETKEMDSMSD